MPVEYVEPQFDDYNPQFPVTAEKLSMLAKQKASVIADVNDPTTELGQGVRAAAADVASSIAVTDNGDGTLTIGA